MRVQMFELERMQSLWENTVSYNLADTGAHPFTLRQLLQDEQCEQLLDEPLGYGYTNGLPELRAAIGALYPGAGEDNVLVTNGTAEANFLALWSCLRPGDELLMMLPNYMQIWGAARALGVETKPFYLKEELGWAPDLDQLHQAASAKTTVIAVCNPNNPTAAVLSEEAMDEIVRVAESVGAWILADEVYRGAELGGSETDTFYGRYDKVLVTSGLSKAYALPGLRIGWLVGPQEAVSSAWAHRDYTTIASGALSNSVAARVLQPEMRARILERTREHLRRNLGVLNDWIGSHGQLLHLIPPRAGGMALVRYNLDISSSEMCSSLRREKSVLVVPGACFGLEPFLRVGFGVETQCLRAGLELVGDYLREL